MNGRRRQHENPDRYTAASTRAADIWISAARWRRATAIGSEFVRRRVSACSCEKERAGEGEEQATSKRPAAAHRAARDITRQFPRRGRPVTDIRFTFETPQHGHDAKTFGFAAEGPSLTRQEFAQECDHNVLMAYGRCLRPALYSSLRSSPSHPTGVSALRVTIAIANARKQWGLRKSTAKSLRLFRNESATSRRVRAGAMRGSTATTRTAFCRKPPRAPRAFWLRSWVLGTSDRENMRREATTERGRDKRPQGAARSVGCSCFSFSLIWQCVASPRNVRFTINSLQGFCFSHIAEAGNG